MVIEDGTGKPDANSYGSIASARQYATDRGVTLDADDTKVTAYLVNGTDYLETFASLFVGTLHSITQALSWPRDAVYYPDGSAFPSNALPSALVQALYQLVIDQQNGIDLLPSVSSADSSSGLVIEEKVDVLTTKYASPTAETIQAVGVLPTLPKVQSLLQSLLRSRPYLVNIRG